MFFWLLLGLSLAPYLIFPTVFAGQAPPNTEQVRQTILFLANAHIAITLYFYWDSGFKQIRDANPLRYVALPLLVVIVAGASYAFTPVEYSMWWWAAYVAWQNWHFGRQGFGLYALAAMDEPKRTPVAAAERVMINLAVAAGALGAMWFVTGPEGFWRDQAMLVRQWCGYLTIALGVIALGYGLYARMPLKRLAFLLLAVLFFLPQYLFPTVDLGFTPYSVAHSLQYLFIMSVVAFNQRHPEAIEGEFDPGLVTAFVFFAIVLVGGAIITIRGEFGDFLTQATGQPTLGKFVFGAMFGLVVAHFVVDAHAWRLREKPQREYVLGRMKFLGKRIVRAPAMAE